MEDAEGRLGHVDRGLHIRGDPAFDQRAEHDFGVHQVLGATKRNQADLQRTGFGTLFCHRPDRLSDTVRLGNLALCCARCLGFTRR
jgi:hypothetical protein